MAVSCPKGHHCAGYYRLGHVPQCRCAQATGTIPERFTKAAMRSTGGGIGGFLGALAIGVGHNLASSSDATLYVIWACDYCESEILFQIIFNENGVIGHKLMTLTA